MFFFFFFGKVTMKLYFCFLLYWFLPVFIGKKVTKHNSLTAANPIYSVMHHAVGSQDVQNETMVFINQLPLSFCSSNDSYDGNYTNNCLDAIEILLIDLLEGERYPLFGE